jgi:hypothetical protein
MECLNGGSADRNSCQDRQCDGVTDFHRFRSTDSLAASFYPTSGYWPSSSRAYVLVSLLAPAAHDAAAWRQRSF